MSFTEGFPGDESQFSAEANQWYEVSEDEFEELGAEAENNTEVLYDPADIDQFRQSSEQPLVEPDIYTGAISPYDRI
jgi:hypothetical protein